MKQRIIVAFLSVTVLVTGGLVIAFNVLNLQEAYGSGPPHFSRTTNMDKWTNPFPVLGVIDAIAVLLIASYLYVLKAVQMKKPRTHRG
nr:hypothetical protein HUO10_004284 [Paraburkholderia busanensis]